MTRREFTVAAAAAGGSFLWSRSPAATRVGPPRSATLTSPEDRTLSPFTGYTRRHWLEITERLLAGILPHIDPDSGRPRLSGVPGDRGLDALYRLNRTMAGWQAMERIMMLAVYYAAATGRDRVPGWTGSITAPFVKGISRMIDPRDPLFCPRTDPSVYLGSETALAVMLCPRFFWEPLTDAQKENLLRFVEALAAQPAYDNNHHLFHMVPVPLLERHGRNSHRAALTEKLERMLQWNRGDGWLIDGGNRRFDHYNFWGFQLYLNALFYLDAPWRREFAPRFREITGEFLRNARWFFGRDGGPIPWGRSLAYRFADNSAIGWAHLNGADPLPPGLARRMASGCLRYFWDRGALGENGVMELGYHGANAVVAENYLTDGINYFAAQGMACLLIPETDPFWSATEEALPADGNGGRLVLRGAEMVVSVRAHDGEARLFPVGQPNVQPGQWENAVKYCQHAYSNALGWCALGEGAPDFGAGRTGYSVDGRDWVYRNRPTALQISERHISSAWPLGKPQSGKNAASQPVGQIITHSLIGESGEVHVCWHTAAQPLRLYLGGYGIHAEDERALERQLTAKAVQIVAGERTSWMEFVDGPRGEFAVNVLPPRPGWRHSHVFGGVGVFPDWRSAEPVARCTPLIVHVDGWSGKRRTESKVLTERRGATLSIRFEDDSFNISIS